MRIGPFTLADPWILAPMAGVSNMPFRLIAREMGAAAAVTELVSCKGLSYRQKKSAHFLTHDDSEQPFWVQLFGGEVEAMGTGAERAVELGAAIIDINMGCPVRKVTKSGAGVALMQDAERAARIVTEIGRRTGVPVTAKIRSGWDAHTVNAVEVARTLADAGCAAIAIHPRTRAQKYSGSADWSVIADVVAAVDIPVIGNGDVRTPEDAHRMLRETGCAAVMIGRAAMGNPWIFAQLAHDAPPPTPAERWQVVERHLAAHIEFVGDQLRALRSFRPQLMWYSHGLCGAHAFRRGVSRVEDLT